MPPTGPTWLSLLERLADRLLSAVERPLVAARIPELLRSANQVVPGVTPAPAAGPPPADLQQEFAAETRRLLTERLLWFAGITAAVLAAATFFTGWSVFLTPLLAWLKGLGASAPSPSPQWPDRGNVIDFLLLALSAAVYSLLAHRVFHGHLRGFDAGRVASGVLMGTGVVSMALAALAHPSPGDLISVAFVPHVVACICLPWTWKEALRPMLVLLVAAAICTIVAKAPTGWGKLTTILLSTLVAAPGTAIALFKHTRRVEAFRTRFFEARYDEMNRELVDARRIHEALFPRPGTHDRLAFDYAYQPMAEIGGDFLFARALPPAHGDRTRPDLAVVLLDVTGHGVSAALTVNRLSGELERLFAENPAATPAQVITGLNRYVHLTMAEHAVFVTGQCLRISTHPDPHDSPQLAFASAGHPPAFLRTADGRLRRLDATATILGVLPPDEFTTDQVQAPFAPGDAVLAYTDGVNETIDAASSMFGIDGVQRALSISGPAIVNTPHTHPPTTSPAQHTHAALVHALSAAVARHRSGAPKDDVLIVQLTHLPPA
ncbi:MAG: serine/threonine-protein phosphatase [Phycisphaerales bacterium]|jgi:hypothetical protein|nr:serine/threonine-protein phosphatase [Phycisphaerales bacterium]